MGNFPMDSLLDALGIYDGIHGFMVAVLMVVAIYALLQCFFGFKIMRINFAIVGFFVGGLIGGGLGVLLVRDNSSLVWVSIVLSLICAVLGAILLFRVYQIGVFLVNTALSGVVFLLLFGINSTAAIVFAAILAIAVGVVSVIFVRVTTICSTGIGGGMAAGIAIGAIIAPKPFVGVVLGVVLAVFGILVQFKTTKAQARRKKAAAPAPAVFQPGAAAQAPAAAGKFCPSCGRPCLTDAAFCSFCGTPFAAPVAPAAPAATVPASASVAEAAAGPIAECRSDASSVPAEDVPAEAPVPVQEAAPADAPAPAPETAPADEPAPAPEAAPADEPAPAPEAAPADEPAPAPEAAPAELKKYCPACGTPAGIDAAFCTFCGQSFSAPPVQTGSAPQTQKKLSGDKRIIIGIAAAVVVILLCWLLYGAVFGRGRPRAAQAAGTPQTQQQQQGTTPRYNAAPRDAESISLEALSVSAALRKA